MARIVYNNFPWPDISEKQKEAIRNTAKQIILAREDIPGVSLADMHKRKNFVLFDKLKRAHQANDVEVMKAYGMPIKETDESNCVAWLQTSLNN